MPRRRSILLKALIGALALYGLFLALGGFLLRGCVEERVRDRLSRALDARVDIGSSSLSIWRGRLTLEDVVAVREDGGALDLRIDEVEADFAGWGAVLLDRDIDRVHARGARMSLSARSLVSAVRRDRVAIPVGELVIEDAHLAVMPTALLPGLGRVETHVVRAEAQRVAISSAVSWLAGLRKLDGEVTGPAGVAVGATFGDGALVVRGSLFGSRSISIPLALSTLDPRAYEIDQLRAIAAQIAKAVTSDLVKDVAKDALFDTVGGWLSK